MKEFFAGIGIYADFRGRGSSRCCRRKAQGGGGRMKNTVKVFVRTVSVIIDIIGIFRKRK